MSSPRLSVVVPAYEAAAHIGQTLHVLLEQGHGSVAEVIVVDDGSRDATSALALQAASRDRRVRVLWHETNLGKGAAVRTGMQAVTGDMVLFTDVDLSAGIDQWPRLVQALGAGADVAIGSRDLEASRRIVDQRWHRRLLGRAFRATCRHRLALTHRDTQCGLKAFTRQAAKHIFERVRVARWAFDAEILVIAKARGFRVDEIAVEWHDVPGSTVRPMRDMFGVWRDLGGISRRMRAGEYR